jgi:hypothetical protein
MGLIDIISISNSYLSCELSLTNSKDFTKTNIIPTKIQKKGSQKRPI